jgi:tagatose-6-phosphate ketose/aldose isomerase
MGRWDLKAVAFECHQGVCVVNALAKLLDLTSEEKIERGLLYTPAEIAQQPATWETTFSVFQKDHARLAEFLRNAGLGDRVFPKPTVFLIGAGTSDYGSSR